MFLPDGRGSMEADSKGLTLFDTAACYRMGQIWQNYGVSLTLSPEKGSQAGVLFAVRDEANCCEWVWSGDFLTLYQVKNGIAQKKESVPMEGLCGIPYCFGLSKRV